MSTTYKTIAGDTFESIARKMYGTELESEQIRRANPGVSEPLSAGLDLAVPDLPSAPLNAPQTTPATSPSEVSVTIEGERFRFWSTIRLVRSIDAVDRVEFTAPFKHDAPGFRETFQPFTYKDMEIFVGGIPLFSGTMVTVGPNIQPGVKTLEVGGYSRPGVLNDVTPPSSAYPLEYRDLKLDEIAADLCKPFGISVEFKSDPGAPFERDPALAPGRRILPFLVDLAQQRDLIISSSSRGALVFQQSTAGGSPVANLSQGSAPVISVTPFFFPQDYYSHITGIEAVTIGSTGLPVTLPNERLKGVIRPFTFTVPDTEEADINAVVSAKSGRMFGNMAAYTVNVATWFDPSGNLWTPNTTVNLLAPDAMIYNTFEFVIRSVEYSKNENSETATLNLVIPGSFSGETPEVLPWDL